MRTRSHPPSRDLRTVPWHARTRLRLRAATALVVSLSACGGTVTPTPLPVAGPSAPETSAAQSVTVAGTVIDWTVPTARRPVPNLRLQVRTMGPADGAVGG